MQGVDHSDVLHKLGVVSEFVVSETGDRVNGKARRQ
jgi:hypothetical protein